MTAKEFEELEVGDLCIILKGKNANAECVVLHKEKTSELRKNFPVSMVVLVKPANPMWLFASDTVSYRHFQLFAHTELRVLSKG